MHGEPRGDPGMRPLSSLLSRRVESSKKGRSPDEADRTPMAVQSSRDETGWESGLGERDEKEGILKGFSSPFGLRNSVRWARGGCQMVPGGSNHRSPTCSTPGVVRLHPASVGVLPQGSGPGALGSLEVVWD